MSQEQVHDLVFYVYVSGFGASAIGLFACWFLEWPRFLYEALPWNGLEWVMMAVFWPVLLIVGGCTVAYKLIVLLCDLMSGLKASFHQWKGTRRGGGDA